ncbi:MAG: thioredoxin family protein [Oligoflexia bacterium]|nr:thioredoxin family protein [Oligoflexia bacterium]
MQRETASSVMKIGASIPTFELLNVDGKRIGSSIFGGARAGLVGFMCNHCPYVKGSELALIQLVREFASKGLVAVTINSNDAVQYPDDSFENMKVKAREMNLPYPYLYDESQAVARSFDAACTPEFYLFDAHSKLAYHGTINDSPRDPTKVTKHHLAQAITQVLEGKPATPNYVHPIGCSIKWRA